MITPDPRIEVIAYELFTSVIFGGDGENWNGPWWVLEKEEARMAAAEVVCALDKWQEANALLELEEEEQRMKEIEG